jgi:hypothetical protein
MRCVTLMLRTCLLLACATQAAPARAATTVPPERLPTRHWSYEEIEELAVAGVLDSLWVYTRPLSRGDVARDLLRGGPRSGADPRFARLRREFALEAQQIDTAGTPAFTPHLVRDEGPDGALRAWPRARIGESREAGRGWHSDALTELGFQGLYQHAPHWSVYADLVARKYPGSRPYADPLFSGSEITFLTEQAYLAAVFGPAELAAGRDRVRWGMGQTGPLLLGDAAAAMSILEYSLHWRRLHATAITSLLDPAQGEYLAGHRLEWRPLRKWYVALSEAARFRSRQPDLLYTSGIIPYTVVQRLLAMDAGPDTTGSVRNNIMVTLEAAFRPMPGLQLGATLLVDDTQHRPSVPGARLGYQANLLWTAAGGPRPGTLRLEYTRIRNYVYSVFYGENFIHQGSSLGYPDGPDLARLAGRFTVDLSRDTRAWLAATYTARGEGSVGGFMDAEHADLQPAPAELSGVVEKTLGLDAGARWFPRDNVQLEGSLGWRRARDAGHVPGARTCQMVGSLFLEGRW